MLTPTFGSTNARVKEASRLGTAVFLDSLSRPQLGVFGMTELWGCSYGFTRTWAKGALSELTRFVLDRPYGSDTMREAATIFHEQLTKFRSDSEDQLKTFGTLTMLWRRGNHVVVAHVGDARVLLVRCGKARAITKQHVEEGHLVRVAGSPTFKVDVQEFDVEQRDMILMASGALELPEDLPGLVGRAHDPRVVDELVAGERTPRGRAVICIPVPARKSGAVRTGSHGSLRFASVSHTGLVRPRNEDTCATGPGVFVVADGLGGHQGGAIASQTAVATVLEVTAAERAQPVTDVLQRALELANYRVMDRLRQMGGTTIDVAHVRGDKVQLAHVGDSRVYRFHEGVLEQLTEDHTVATEKVQRGLMTPEQAETSRDSHVLTRSIGSDVGLKIDFHALELAASDVLLMCSDGLTAALRKPEIESIVAKGGADVRGICERLLSRSLEAGAPDNVTILVIYRSPSRAGTRAARKAA